MSGITLKVLGVVLWRIWRQCTSVGGSIHEVLAAMRQKSWQWYTGEHRDSVSKMFVGVELCHWVLVPICVGILECDVF